MSVRLVHGPPSAPASAAPMARAYMQYLQRACLFCSGTTLHLRTHLSQDGMCADIRASRQQAPQTTTHTFAATLDAQYQGTTRPACSVHFPSRFDKEIASSCM